MIDYWLIKQLVFFTCPLNIILKYFKACSAVCYKHYFKQLSYIENRLACQMIGYYTQNRTYFDIYNDFLVKRNDLNTPHVIFLGPNQIKVQC